MDWLMMANQQVQAYPDLPPEELTMKLLGNMMSKQALGHDHLKRAKSKRRNV